MKHIKVDIINLPVILFKSRGRHLTINAYPVICGIYKITSPNGSIYIGLSSDIYYRIHSCYKLLSCKEQKRIYNSLKKHGVENHTFEIIHILEKGNLNKLEIIKELNKLEIFYIKEYNCFIGDNQEFGLNLTRGGGSLLLTDEAWERINNSKKGRKQSPETIAKRAKKNKGKIPSIQTIAAAVLANTGIIRSPETRQKLREKNLGKKASPETIKKQSDSNKGKKRSPETIQKLSKSKIGVKNPMFGKLPHNKGVKMSDEAKRKNSESHLGQVAWNKGIKMPEEQRLKQSGKNSSVFGKKQTEEHIIKAKENRKIKREERLSNGNIQKK